MNTWIYKQTFVQIWTCAFFCAVTMTFHQISRVLLSPEMLRIEWFSYLKNNKTKASPGFQTVTRLVLYSMDGIRSQTADPHPAGSRVRPRGLWSPSCPDVSHLLLVVTLSERQLLTVRLWILSASAPPRCSAHAEALVWLLRNNFINGENHCDQWFQ